MDSALPGGLLLVVIVAATVALLAFLAATVAQSVERRCRPAAWASAALLAALVSMMLGRYARDWHAPASVATALLALRNVIRFRGVPRVLAALALAAWTVSVAAALALFR